MRKIILAITAVFALMWSEGAMQDTVAADVPVVRQATKAEPICRGPKCGPYALCVGRSCRVTCPDYSCYPLYGAYGPYGGVGYWGAYTFAGWDSRW
jgi:hypothetical protein